MRRLDYDLIVIGSGSGGATAAQYAASLGKEVAIIEKGVIGGDCPNYACIPTKTLLHVAQLITDIKEAETFGISVTDPKVNLKRVQAWKEKVIGRTGAAQGPRLFEADGIDVIEGEARFTSPHEVRVGNKHYSAHHFLIATGAHIAVPPIHGLEKTGYITYMQAGDMTKLPKSVAIIGGGVVGVEYSFIYEAFGIEATIIEGCDRLIMAEDAEATAVIESIMKDRGIKLELNAIIKEVYPRGDKKVVAFDRGGKEFTVSADEILVATGMAPNTDLDLEKAGVAYDKHGIAVNDYLQTRQSHIYAAGDVTGPIRLTATGYYQSYMAVVNMFSRKRQKVNYDVVPRCLFVDPELASVGVSEEKLKENKIPYKKGVAPIAQIGRANSDNVLEGLVKVLTSRDGKILGASIVSPRAGEMIHEIAVAMKLGAKASDLAHMIHVYPSYSEAVKIACAMVE